MDRRTLLLDTGLALLALVIAMGTLATGGFGTPHPDAVELDAFGVVLVLVATVPLAVRRLAPVPVHAVISLATLALLLSNYPLDFPLSAYISGYTVAVTCGGRPGPVRFAALAAVAGLGPAIAVAYAVAGEPSDLVASVFELSFVSVLFGAVWIGGDRSRLRQEQLAALRERAWRGKREIEREHRLAAAQERTRIARELHDAAGHAISVILMQAGAARLLHERDPERSKRALHTIEEVARGTMDEIDRLVHALREDEQPDLPPPGPAAIEELLRRYRAEGLRLTSRVRGAGQRVPPSVAWAAYRIVQEGLTNATKHGEGSADVAVRFAPGEVEISVTNPARPAASHGGGHGIVGMRERATLLGGTLEAGAEAGTYRLAARLPHHDAAGVSP